MELVEAGFKPRQETYELESVPGGYVELKRLNHGESNELTDLRLAYIPAKSDDDDDVSGAAKTTIRLSRHYSFSRSIVDHNLGKNGKKFNFKKRRDVDDLDPVIGDEIAQLIDKHNETMEENEIPNSSKS